MNTTNKKQEQDHGPLANIVHLIVGLSMFIGAFWLLMAIGMPAFRWALPWIGWIFAKVAMWWTTTSFNAPPL